MLLLIIMNVLFYFEKWRFVRRCIDEELSTCEQIVPYLRLGPYALPISAMDAEG